MNEELNKYMRPDSLILPDLIFDPETAELEWVKSTNLKDDEEIFVPANAVYHPYIP